MDFVSYEPLFRCCTVSQVVDIFLSLLQESRVILVCSISPPRFTYETISMFVDVSQVAKKIDVLTACVNAVSAMSYPFRVGFFFFFLLKNYLPFFFFIIGFSIWLSKKQFLNFILFEYSGNMCLFQCYQRQCSSIARHLCRF